MPPVRRSRPAAARRRRLLAPLALAVVVIAVAVVVLSSGSASPTNGYDVSFPQCSVSLPGNPLFGVVGVNRGLANTANPCLSAQIAWAKNAPGESRPAQPGISLYINTGNPGGHHVKDFPTRGTAPAYGACNGGLTDACSYLYGEERAQYSYRLVAAHDEAAARTAPWWLDVELIATWAGTYRLNIAALQGFIAGLHTAGATGPIGIYSTSAQWKDITGLTARTTPTAFNAQLPDWVAGIGTTRARARAACRTGGFTGVPPTLAQYRTGQQDADVRCPG